MKPLIFSLLCLFLLSLVSSQQACISNICYTDANGLSQDCPVGCTACSLVGSLPLCSSCYSSYFFNSNTQVCDVKNTCSAGGYYNETNNQCFACPPNCTLCSYNETNTLHKNVTCTACKGEFILNNASGTCANVTVCESDQYFNSSENSCKNCSTLCSSCEVNAENTAVNCTSCQEGAFHNANGTCENKKQCSARQFYNSSDNSCGNCSENCKICEILNETVICQNCTNGFFLNVANDSCDTYPECGEKQFLNKSDNTCNQCPVNCTSCILDANVSNHTIICSPCTVEYFYNVGNGSCDAVPHCAAASFYNETDNKCYPCPVNCTNCSQDFNNAENGYVSCTSCKNDSWFNGTQESCEAVTQCEAGFVYNIIDNSCTECPEYCGNCSLSNETIICLSCNKDGWFNNETFSCDLINTCSAGGYYNQSINQCFACPKNCTICVYDASNLAHNNVTCTNCSNGSSLNVTSGACNIASLCFEGSFYNESNKTCEKCPVNCTTCNMSNASIKCLTCESNFFYNESNGSCDVVPICDNSSYYNSSDNTCNKCQDNGTFFNSTDNTCTSCPVNCTECTFDANNSQVNCTSCKNDTFYNESQGSCDAIPSCSNATYYNATDNTCNECPENCSSCVVDLNDTINCSVCEDGFFPNVTQGSCDEIPICDNGTFYNSTDNTCNECPFNCTECTFDVNNSQVNCSSCKNDSFYNESQSSCDAIPSCSNATYYNATDNTCNECPDNCSICAIDANNTENINCSVCEDGFFKNVTQGSCDEIPVCDNGTFYNSTDNTCNECPSNCTECAFDANNSQVNCSSCKNDSFYNESQGSCDVIPSCSNATYYNATDNTCNDCPVNCTSCSLDLNKTNKSLTCNSCILGSFFNSTNGSCEPLPFCENGSFYDVSNNSCKVCPSYCEECFYDTLNNLNNNITCDSCNASGWLNLSSQACEKMAICPNGTYFNNSNNSCPVCPEYCSACEIDENTTNVTCTTCNETGWFNASEGLCDEKAVCTVKTYFNDTINVCFSCPVHCANCSYDEENIEKHNISCSSCVNNSFLNDSSFSCDLKSVCDNGTFYNFTDNYCYDCPETCSECTYDEENTVNFNVSCSACANDSYFNDTTKACQLMPLCENGTFYNVTDHLCHNCSLNCMNCSANASDVEHNGTTCYSCDESAWYNAKKKSCIPRGNCLGDTYYNESIKTCLFCPFYCSVCYFDDTNPDYNNITCTNCLAEGFLNENLGTCELKSRCRVGSYLNMKDNSCEDCGEGCEECQMDENVFLCTKYEE